jgi:hypothetical protein
MGVRKFGLKCFCKWSAGLAGSWMLAFAACVSFASASLPPLRPSRPALPGPARYPFSVSPLTRSASAFLPLGNRIQDFALRHLGRPYRSSGKNPVTGFDCSGFTGFVFRHFGVRLKSSSGAQATEGKRIPFSEARPGDLAFFARRGRRGSFRVYHSAIVISSPGQPLEIVHSASGKGIVTTRIDQSRYWRNALLFVRRVL